MGQWFSRAAAAAFILAAVVAGSAPARAQSVMAACASQWKQAQATGATGGATWPEFLARCKKQGGGTASAPAAPAPAPWWQPAQTSAPAPTGAGQFRTEAEAKYRCPADKVVWLNTNSKIYHQQGSRWYARTRQGAYMCEADAKAAGDRAARSMFGRGPA